MTPDDKIRRRIDLARAAEGLQTAITWAEEAGRVDLSNAAFDLHERFMAAIDDPEHGGRARVVARGTAGGRAVKPGGCER